MLHKCTFTWKRLWRAEKICPGRAGLRQNLSGPLLVMSMVLSFILKISFFLNAEELIIIHPSIFTTCPVMVQRGGTPAGLIYRDKQRFTPMCNLEYTLCPTACFAKTSLRKALTGESNPGPSCSEMTPPTTASLCRPIVIIILDHNWQ